MYQPALRPEQIRALYYLKCFRKVPMTQLLREAVDTYFAAIGGPHAIIPSRERRRDGADRPRASAGQRAACRRRHKRSTGL